MCYVAIVIIDFTLIPPSAGPACYTLLTLIEIEGAKLEQLNFNDSALARPQF